MAEAVRKITLVLAMVVGLFASVQAYTILFTSVRAYYTYLSPGLENATGVNLGGSQELGNCDVETCIRLIAGLPQQEGMHVGACDLFMYSGGVAVAGFLCFMLVYVFFLVLGMVLVGMSPLRWKKPVLIGWSLLFLIVALPLRPALWFLEFIVVLAFVFNLPFDNRVRAVLLAVAALLFYPTLGHDLVESCVNEYFSASRLYIPPQWMGSHVAEISNFMISTHLGQLNSPRMHDQGFPYLFLALALLLKTFRRLLWLVYEVWNGRAPRGHDADFFIYFLGLPSLIGNAATPSYSYFVHQYGRGESRLSGARTLAICIGAAGFAYTCIVMMGYSPAVRVLFPRCDLATAAPWIVWSKLLITVVIEYLFLLATEQASVGVARFFGYGLKDNYAQPLTSRSLADFWRRWNIYWREFLVTVFYIPTSLLLGRIQSGQRRWHVVAATLVTFLGTFVLNILPLALLSGFGDMRLLIPQATQPGPGLAGQSTAGEEIAAILTPSVVQWMQLVPSLAVYYGLEGLIVAITLALEFRRPRASDRRGVLPRLWTVCAIIATLATVAALRCFLDANISLHDQFRTLARAVGLGW